MHILRKVTLKTLGGPLSKLCETPAPFILRSKWLALLIVKKFIKWQIKRIG